MRYKRTTNSKGSFKCDTGSVTRCGWKASRRAVMEGLMCLDSDIERRRKLVAGYLLAHKHVLFVKHSN